MALFRGVHPHHEQENGELFNDFSGCSGCTGSSWLFRANSLLGKNTPLKRCFWLLTHMISTLNTLNTMNSIEV